MKREVSVRERAVLIVNPAAGKRHAEDGDLAECVRLLGAAGFDIDRRDTGPEGPTSADLAKSAVADGFRVVLVAGGDGTVAPAAIALIGTEATLVILPFGSFMNIANGLGIPLKPVDAALPIVPNANMTDGLLDVAIFPRKGRLELIRWMATIWHTGRPGRPPRLLRGKVIELASSEAVPVHADGQIAGRLPVTVRCCEGALRVFA